MRHDCTTRNAKRAARLQHLVDELEQRIRTLAAADAEARRRPALSGDEIMEFLAIPPGPAVGEAVRFLLDHEPPAERSGSDEALRSWWGHRTTDDTATH